MVEPILLARTLRELREAHRILPICVIGEICGPSRPRHPRHATMSMASSDSRCGSSREITLNPDAVSAMKALKTELERAADTGGGDADLATMGKQLDTLVEKLQTLRTNVETIL